jgi:hypothetical protein
MTQHVQQPRLCPECETAAHALAETGPPDDRVIKRCSHGGDGAVIAVAAKRGGAIVNWHLEGPLTEEQADILGDRILLAMAAAGMKVHDITRQ